MKILITGASGMVGSNLVEHPSALQYQLLTPSSTVLNLLSTDAVLAYMQAHQPDLVIHCAGTVGGIQANIAAPVKFFSDNMRMSMNVISGAKEMGVTRLLNLGSSCMYPRAAVNPLKEDMVLTGELEPTNEGYALAKIAAARLCDYITQEQPELSYKTLIPCNLYGRHDKFGANNSHMIPAVIAKISDARDHQAPSVEIWGDGKARREFMYAGDLADFIYFAIDQIGSLPSLVNVGPGHDYTINEYYQTIAAVLGYEGEFVHDLTKPIGMQQKLVDTTRLQRLGWTPRTSLTDGIKHAYQFYMEGKNG